MVVPLTTNSSAITVGVMAGLAAGAWLALLGVMARATRPKFAAPIAGGMELAGEEPAAIANFLVDWRVSPEAVPATVVDLAARGFIEIEHHGPRRFVVRVRGKSRDAAELAPYERRILDHIRELAVDDVVPVGALTTGPQEQSKRWWQDFKSSIVHDAKRRGLARPRWSRRALFILEATALVPAILAGIAVALADSPKKPGEDNDSPLALAFFAWASLSVIVGVLRSVRDTPAGLEAQGRLLGLKRYLAQNEQFATKEPSSVAIWDRYLAYAVAMGLAGTAARALPMGTESATSEWSAYGGVWREVRIRYPSGLWAVGRNPLSVLVESLLWLGIGLPVAIALVPALGKGAVDLASVRDAGPLLALTLFGAVVFLVVSAMVVMALARAFVLLTRSVTDLRQRRVVDGIVLRLKENLVVIYDGKDPVAHAVGLPAGAPSLAEGTIVRATLSPRLKHLYKIEIVRPPKRAISEAAPQEEPKPGTEFLVPTDLDWLGDFILSEIRAATGLPFEKSARNAMPVMRMKSASKTPFGVFSFEASGRGRIGLAVAAEDSLVGRRLEDSRLVKALLRPRSVEGIGNWAKWYRGGTLIVQFDESRLAVWVRIKGVPRDKRLEIARILASKVVDRFRHADADTKADTT